MIRIILRITTHVGVIVADTNTVAVPVFLVFRENADSWQGGRTFSSVHGSLEKAREVIPLTVRTLQRDVYGPNMIENYTYFTIERHEVSIDLAAALHAAK